MTIPKVHQNNSLLSRCPTPRKLIFDNGNEYKKDSLLLHKDFSIEHTSTIIKNPQTNSILSLRQNDENKEPSEI